MFSFVDELAMRIPPSCCIVCQLKSLREPYHRRENKTAALVFDPGTEVYTLKRLEDIDGKSKHAPYPNPLLSPRAHYPRSRESHLPQLPSYLSAIHQTPAPR